MAPPAPSSAEALARDTFARIGDKWTLLVIYTLGEGPLRFSELRDRAEGISQKMLTQTLRALERDGLIRRTVVPASPPAVEYALEPPGRSLHSTVSAICQWARANVEEVERARAAFDARYEIA